jgi:hypothetical protein
MPVADRLLAASVALCVAVGAWRAVDARAGGTPRRAVQESAAAAAASGAARARHRDALVAWGAATGAPTPAWVAELYAARLVVAAERRVALAGDLAPPPDAAVRRRTLAGAPGPHYLGGVGDERGGDGGLRRWAARAEPLGVWVAPAPAALDSLPRARAHAAVMFGRWNALGLGVTFAPEADSSRAAVHVTWADALGRPASGAGADGPVPVGHTLLVTDGGGWAVGAHVTLAVGFDGAALQDAALHEAGHVLGLGHSPDPHDVMTPVTAGRHFAPTAADVRTARLLYALRPGPLVGPAR